MENHENFHHDELLERAVEAVLRDPIHDELPPDRVAQLAGLVRQAAEQPHPITLIERITYFLGICRWIMRHPVSRAAAAVIFVLALGGVALWFHTAGATLTFADFVRTIVDAKTVKYKMTAETEGQPPLTSVGMVLLPNRMRDESRQKLPDGFEMRQVTITDYQKGKSIILNPEQKTAFVTTYINMPKDMASKSWFAKVRSLLLNARDKPEVKREPLGEKKIDGHKAIGYRLSGHGVSDIPGMVMSLWGDPKTGLPIRAEMTMWTSGKEMKLTMSDFVFNADLDESLFSVEPPAGYTARNMRMDLSPPAEKDLIETLRRYSQQGGATFPDALDLQGAFSFAGKGKIEWKNGKKPTEQQIKDVEQQMQEDIDAKTKLTRGLIFVLQLPPEADAHYAGKGVSLGAAGKSIFWYRPKDAKKYRVIYADLSVRDTDTPPNVPNAQPVPGLATPKK